MVELGSAVARLSMTFDAEIQKTVDSQIHDSQIHKPAAWDQLHIDQVQVGQVQVLNCQLHETGQLLRNRCQEKRDMTRTSSDCLGLSLSRTSSGRFYIAGGLGH